MIAGRIVSVFTAATLLGACGSTKTPIATPSASARPSTNTSSGGSTSVDPAMRPLVDAAIDDLVRRLHVDRAAIVVLEARSVVWPDGSLGCPRPDMVYPQVQQDGALIRLRAEGKEFSYHSGGTRPPFLCESAS
jgi:hypothetical protein